MKCCFRVLWEMFANLLVYQRSSVTMLNFCSYGIVFQWARVKFAPFVSPGKLPLLSLPPNLALCFDSAPLFCS